MKQLEKNHETKTLSYVLIRDYITELINGKISTISRNTGRSTAEIRKAIERIALLDPDPLKNFSGTKEEYVRPDVILHWDKGWKIEINDHWAEDYRINDYYLRMREETKDKELKKYFDEHLKRARLIQSAILQRRETILKIMVCISEYQTEFLRGMAPLKVLTMTSAARELSISPSTISRAVMGKYAEYPYGTILIKDLFPRGIVNRSGQEPDFFEKRSTVEDVKKKIRDIVSSEDNRKPYCDSALCKELEIYGIRLSRRTVAKYRKEMNIPDSYERISRI